MYKQVVKRISLAPPLNTERPPVASSRPLVSFIQLVTSYRRVEEQREAALECDIVPALP